MSVIFESYKDILTTIGIIQAEIEGLQLDLEYWLGQNSDHLLFSEGASKYGLDVATQRVDFIYGRIRLLEERLTAYKEIEQEIRENVDKLEGLQHSIAKLRFIFGLTYSEIAEQLGYSERNIKRVASSHTKAQVKTIIL